MGGRWPLLLGILVWVGGACTFGGGAPPTPPLEVLAEGERLYAQYCQTCHGDVRGVGRIPPAPPHNETGHTWHHPDDQLRAIVLFGSPSGRMPAFQGQLTLEQVDAILAYIKTWWTEDQRRYQAEISERFRRQRR